MKIIIKQTCILMFISLLSFAQNTNFRINYMGEYRPIVMQFQEGEPIEEHWVGTIEIEDTDTGDMKYGYCIQAHVNTTIDELYTRDALTDNVKLAYIMDHYYPTTNEPASLTNPADKAVAVQFAVWLAVGDFTVDFLTEDRLDPNQSNYNQKWTDIQTAKSIYSSTPDTYDYSPTLTLTKQPEGVLYLQKNDICNLTVTLTQFGNPLQGVDVNLSMADTESGPSANADLWAGLSPAGAVKTFQTDADGEVNYSYEGENAIYDSIEVSATINQTFAYELVNSSNKQRLVFALDAPLTVENGLLATWDDGTPPVAIELSSFNAYLTELGNRIEWTAESETNHAGYNIYRSRERSGYYVQVNEQLIINPDNTTPRTYEFTDVHTKGDYYYKLQEVELDGSGSFYGPIFCESAQSVTRTHAENQFSLRGNYPNPFNASTTFEFNLPTEQWVELSVYSVTGKRITTIVDEHLAAGQHRINWDGTDKTGYSLPSGVYLYTLQSSQGKSIRGQLNLIK